MNIEKEVFQRRKINFSKLINYGFTKEKDTYIYSKKIMNDDFILYITITSKGDIKGKIYDLESNEEYINYRIEDQNGSFVNQVRTEYTAILKDIAEQCFDKNDFILPQTNRIAKAIKEIYQDSPHFMWEKYPGYGVFKNPQNQKWYAAIMNIDKSKLNENMQGETEIIDIKLDPKTITTLLNNKGYYPAYHMNKQHWLTIILDDTISDTQIIELIRKSHEYTE